MIKVNIKRVSDNIIGWSATFQTEDEALNWVSSQVTNKSWGRPERWIRADIDDNLPFGENKEDSDQVRSVQVLDDITVNEYHFKADYLVYLVDLGDSPKLELIRQERNNRLAECDWTQLADAPLSSEKKQEFAEYRQALRDLPQLENLNVNNPQWPSKPSM
jgi:hypothetical protein